MRNPFSLTITQSDVRFPFGRHDVKAVEYFLKEEYDTLKFPEPCKEFIHFALTSEDVNSTARPLALKDCLEKTYLPKLDKIRETLMEKVTLWDGIPMLVRYSAVGGGMLVVVLRCLGEHPFLHGVLCFMLAIAIGCRFCCAVLCADHFRFPLFFEHIPPPPPPLPFHLSV